MNQQQETDSDKIVRLTPSLLRALLEVYTLPDCAKDHPVVSQLIRNGLLANPPGKLDITPKGLAWIKAALNVPEPRLAYVDENNNVLNHV